MSESVPPISQEVLYYNSSNQIAGNTALTLDTKYLGTRLDTDNLLVNNKSLLIGDVGIHTGTPRSSLEVTGNAIITSQGSESQNTHEFGLNGSYDSLSIVSPVGLGLNGTTSIFFGLNSVIYYPVARIVAVDNGNYSGSLAFQIGNGEKLFQQMRLTMKGVVTGNAAFLYETIELPTPGTNFSLNLPVDQSTTSIIDVYITLQKKGEAATINMIKFTIFLGNALFVTDISIRANSTSPIIVSPYNIKVVGSKILINYSDVINVYIATVNYMVYGPASNYISSIIITLNDAGTISAPGVPSSLTATPGNISVLLDWNAPPDGGSTITGYTISDTSGKSVSNSGSLNGSGIYSAGLVSDAPGTLLITNSTVITDTKVNITGLTNGQSYTFIIKANNSKGYSGTATITVIPAIAPGQPIIGLATYGIASATVSWTAPTNDGGLAITSYTITSTPGSLTSTVDGTLRTGTVFGLTNGTSYTFTVYATNGIGSSSQSSASNSVTPKTVPDAPTITSKLGKAGSVTITWSAPSSDGGSSITGYTVSDTSGNSLNTGGTFDSSGIVYSAGITSDASGAILITDARLLTNRSVNITGLADNTSYIFRIKAKNSEGYSALSSDIDSVTTLNVPGVPTSVNASAGIRSATVSWTAPTNTGGSPITGYAVYDTSGNLVLDASGNTGTTATVTGLTNGTSYNYVVKTVNLVGLSLASSAVSFTTFSLPGAPTSLSAISGDTTVTLSWTAPNSANDGTPITGYKIYNSGGDVYNPVTNLFEIDTAGTIISTTGVTITIQGLTNGTLYTFRIKTVNLAGVTGSFSTFSSIIPGLPSAPLNLTGISGDTKITLNWQTPLLTGGSPITGYKVYDTNSTVIYDGTGNLAITKEISGLTNGTEYNYYVKALNNNGSSVASTTLTITAGYPTTPTGFTAEAGDKQVTFNWNASTPYASPDSILGYKLFYVSGTLYDASGNIYNTGTNTLYNSSGNLVADASGIYSTLALATTKSVSTYLNNSIQYTFSLYAVNTYGRSSIPASISVSPGLPDSPTDLNALVGNSQVYLSWTAPSNNGGSVITGYKIYDVSGNVYNPNTNTFVSDASGTILSTTGAVTITITGLTNGTLYTFKVQSVNANGKSINFISSSVTPFTTPGVPINIITTSTNTTGTISWQPPLSNGGSSILGYKIYDSSGNIYNSSGNAVPDTGSIYSTNSNTYTITGLTVGNTYNFNLKSSNAAGNSDAFPVTIKTGVPGTPTNLTATPGDESVDLSWTAPTGTVTGYIVSYSGISVNNAGTSITISNLINATQYTFSVVATNSNGNSLTPAFISATPGLPGAPTGLTGSVGTGSVSLSWTAPSNTGGSSITGYKIYSASGNIYNPSTSTFVSDSAGTILSSTITSITISGLTSNTSYTFIIYSANANGKSINSISTVLIPN